MSDYAQNDPTGPASLGEVGGNLGPSEGDVGGNLGPSEGHAGAPDTNWVDPDVDTNTDLMRPDSDPLPDAQVPGAGPDGQAPNTPAV
jgi:hypothetical protein